MTPVALGLLAVGLSMDAFVVSLGQGAAADRRGFAAALQTGMIFGLVEMATPIIGWVIGLAAVSYVAAIDHWVAFVLLGGVGARMAFQSWYQPACDGSVAHMPRSRGAVVLSAIGTSLDAMVVGITLALLNVNIVLVAIAIGLTTTVASTAGVMLGHLLGKRFGRAAGTCAGAALILMGASILVSHIAV
ncbi:manganese efflux pump MntP [Neptunicoccus cionae]|uniref:Putative manganese efflux pump MntP n=1 Tax=Neptunicoccus cionae TaxID=2035344 RepID=A0A916QVQ0_9RHOB|nr:manganese efflux pump MntP family protein [Amylibacter cionae]GGA14509.1 putative manganese efflux pump MntP [Amylibacter cionae]